MFTNTLKHLNSIDLEFQFLPNNEQCLSPESQTRNNEICKKSAIEEAEEIGCKELVLVLTILLEDIFKTSDSEKLLNLKLDFREWMHKDSQQVYVDDLIKVFSYLNEVHFNDIS